MYLYYHMKEGLVEMNSISASDSETNEEELTEIINEIKKIDSSKLPNVLNFVRELQLGAEEINDAN